MSTIKVDAITTRSGSGEISLGTIGSQTINRTGDGTALTLQAGGTTFGTIGQDGSDLVIDGPSGHTGLRMTTSGLLPRQNSSLINNTIDLGSSGYTFNDLYLGGGLYVGGTGAANHLDDYEEGTFTPVLDFGGGTTGIQYGTQVGKYTKIGNLVVVCWRMYLTNKGSSTGHAHVGGFPFQLSGITGGVFQYISNRGGLSLSDEHAYLYFEGANTRFSVYQGDNDGTGNSTVQNGAFGNNTELEGFMQYTTTS